MKVASFFSGIGGFDLGFENAGMEVVFQCEKDDFCQKVLQKHWPDVALKSDITKVKTNEIPEANLWCGGFPCQDLSSANQGKRKGINGDRSGLFFRFSELLEKKLPKWVVLENVPGLFNSDGGEDFKVLLQTLDEFGYGVSWRVLDAKYFGTPQRRRRVFIVGSFGDLSSSRVLFERRRTEFTSKARRGKEQAHGSRLGKRNDGSGIYSIQHASIGRKPSAGPQGKGYRSDGETYTLDSRGSADAVCSPDDGFRIRKTSGLSGRMDSYRYRTIGNAACVPVVEWLGKRILKVEEDAKIEIENKFPAHQD